MRVISMGFNQGSLFRRTVVHVASFVLGAFAVISLLSFVCVSIAKGLLPTRSEAASGDGVNLVVGKPGAAKDIPMKPRLGGAAATAARASGKDG